MEDYEKLGAFYIGRSYDPITRQSREELQLLKSKQLSTHGLIIGMTGSGKTGLGIGLIEEAAIDAIPVIVIDPKGDLGNLLLTFPDLLPEQFEPWVNAEEAGRKGISLTDHARQQAGLWSNGLTAWGQNGERIRRLKEAAEFALYTPGSNAGRPVSILKSFTAPPPEIRQDFQLLGERIASTVASLLGLLGINADPVRSRETILLSHLLQSAWTRNRNLDLGTLIQEVQNPSVERIGVMDMETFFPSKDRFELAMQMNNLLAAPGFAAWLEGEPLDIKNMLFTPTGRPRIAIFSIAHLNDPERMFFVTSLLNELLGWMRQQSGTDSLRAMLYMDEIFGYFPPVSNPPSKLPLLTLLKQARAFGLGVVLSTQNPVDLDYKGLANIGTWFIGRLQTDRDKARVMEGLEGAAAGQAAGFDRQAMERTLAGLGNRVFLQHSVYQDQPSLFETRWTLSYLRGPLSRDQIQSLSHPTTSTPAPTPLTPAPFPSPTASTHAAPDPALTRQVLPPEIPQFFVPTRTAASSTGTLLYQPRLLGAASVRFKDARTRVDVTEEINLTTEITDTPIPVDWSTHEPLPVPINDLEKAPAPAAFKPCAPAATRAANYPKWNRDLAKWIHSNHKLSLWKSNHLQLTSNPGETEQDFRIRLRQASHEQRDVQTEKLRQKFEPKLDRLQERLRRAQAAREREASQAQQARAGTLVSLGTTLLGAFLGRKAISSGTLGRAGSTVRGAGRAMQQAGDVKRAEETIAAIEQQIHDLDTTFKEEAGQIADSHDPSTEELERLELSPTKTNIHIRLLALVWIP